MFMCQRQYSHYSKYRTSGNGGGGGITSDRRHSPVTTSSYTNGAGGSSSSTTTSATTNTNEDLESSSAGTTTECSSSFSGCLGNVIGGARGGSAKCPEKKSGFGPGVSFSANTTPCHSETRSNCGGTAGFRRRQRRRRRPVYFGSNGVTVVSGTISTSIASASPDCRADSSVAAEATRRRRPVQPWHIQQQITARVSEVRYQMSNLSTTYGNGAQHPVTMVDSSWWPVSQPVSVCIDMYKGFKA